MTLVEFLLARIAEDEADARKAAVDEGGRWLVGEPFYIYASFGEHGDRMGGWSGLTDLRRMCIADHIVRHDPARVLVECDAKRRIVESYQQAAGDEEMPAEWNDGYVCGQEFMLKLLAQPYADHPDFDPAWR